VGPFRWGSRVSAETILFWVFAVFTVGSAAIVIAARSPINSAMALVSTFFFLAGLYVLLWAHTIAVLQVLVYTGAIMVLFLFVIMLLSLNESTGPARITVSRILGGAGAAGMLAALTLALSRLRLPENGMTPDIHTFGTLQRIGAVLYGQYLLPFEAVSLLLLVAIVGAVVVAKPRI